jgi:hypothetical protein
MNMHGGMVGTAGLVLVAAAAAVAEERPASRTGQIQAAEIQQLIEQLGSRNYRDRQAASRRLNAIGGPALAPLQTAATTSRDPEIRRQGRALARAIDERLYPRREPLTSGPAMGEFVGDVIEACMINGPDPGKRQSLV